MTHPLHKRSAEAVGRAIDRAAPDVPTWRRERESGGSRNEMDELVGSTTNTLDFRAVEESDTDSRTDRDGVPDEEISLSLHTTEDVLEEHDRVVRLDDSEPFEVVSVERVTVGNEHVASFASLTVLND